MLVCRCFYAGWGEGKLPNMTGGHVFVREPVNRVQITIKYKTQFIYPIELTAGGGGGGGGGVGGGGGTIFGKFKK